MQALMKRFDELMASGRSEGSDKDEGGQPSSRDKPPKDDKQL